MKVVGIFRGFPGLGRVVPGINILQELQKREDVQVKIFSYLQGIDLGLISSYNIETIVRSEDISSIGIIPVSPSGEKIIDEIEKFQPNFVIIDGEPLLVLVIKLRFPSLKVVVLLNPFDIENPKNKISSQLFFINCYSKADVAIVHGLWQIKKPLCFQNSFYSINTIVRNQILEIENANDSKRIVCILGGGTVNSSESFYLSTTTIAEHTILLADCFPELSFEIFCGNTNIYTYVITKTNSKRNVRVFESIENVNTIYNSAKLIISRAGRNTISELLMLNIPALLFATMCDVRGSEQTENIKRAAVISDKIIGLNIQSDKTTILKTFKKLISFQQSEIQWHSGNTELINIFKNELLCI